MSENINQLSIQQLLDGKDQYVIPMYQRNYAWDEAEITQLIQDVLDYIPEEQNEYRNYYIGNLVVYERVKQQSRVFEVIDGQQRLTTLSLLACFIKNSESMTLDWFSALNIQFDSRENSSATFEAIFQRKFNHDPAELLEDHQINPNILNGYRLIRKILPQKLQSERGLSIHAFAAYLFDFVKILRIKVPADTDLNHYFEIMNNRGEQLEKHEVLKARLMEQLKDCQSSQACLHYVWEACANMEQYVQMGFTPAQRSSVFGENNWGQFLPQSFDELARALQPVLPKGETQANHQSVALTLEQIVGSPTGAIATNSTEDDSPARFNTVINFPNFLLHVLRIQIRKDIALDDKRLLDSFQLHVLEVVDPVADVKTFIYNLLRCKYLFDKYVIKREFIKGQDSWSLKRLKWNAGGDRNPAGRANYVNTFGKEDEEEEGINRRILMLLSAFHVSTPTMVFKHWLNGVLCHLFYTDKRIEIQGQAYCEHLESLAKAFVFDRFLARDGGLEYFDMIYKHNGRCQAKHGEMSRPGVVEPLLRYGSIENNLVFNFLDYLLWCSQRGDEPAKSYEFTFRSSVEHYYPQKPEPGFVPLESEDLDSFGNLCLISHEKNSRLSNRMPTAKKEFYANNQLDSLKQYLMMKEQTWDAYAIREHGQAMVKMLLESLDSVEQNNESIHPVG